MTPSPMIGLWAATFLLVPLAGIATAAEHGVAADPGGAGIVACDGLVALRELTIAAPDPSAARLELSRHPGCRSLDRAALGAVERRAMIGGAPFECLTPAAGGPCLWVMP